MTPIRIATANIYWYGLTPAVSQARKLHTTLFHSEADDARLVTMLSRIAADLWCFQEIVDVARFERVLGKVDAALSLRDAIGVAVASAPEATQPDGTLRTILAWNTRQLALLDWERLKMWTRRPVRATFLHKASGRRLQVVGVHTRSSAPDSQDDPGRKKREELAALAAWVGNQGAADAARDGLILGDLNATVHGEDARHLRQGPLAQWTWREADGDAGSRWTTTTDRVVIDHILLSPSLAQWPHDGPAIVYFDRDDVVPDAAPAPGMLKRLTDHRPVTLSLSLGPD